MIEFKVTAGYIRRFRDDPGKKVTALATFKAVTSSGGIAAWAIWKEYAFLWGVIIVISDLKESLIMRAVKVQIPMPQGAAVPAQTPPQASSPAQARPTQTN